MIFGNDRDELRQMYFDAWQKSVTGAVLSPLELASFVPSGLQATHMTMCVCPLNVSKVGGLAGEVLGFSRS